LPDYIFRNTIYFSDHVFKRAMFLQTGLTFKYFSNYYANEYNPLISSFHIQNDKKIGNFPMIDVFVKVAKHIISNGSLDVIGKEIKEIKQLTEIKPVINQKKDQILGSVIYIDNYGNVITNITKKIFNEIGKSRPFTIEARRIKFKKIYSSYSQAIDYSIKRKKREEDGKKLALFNSAEHLELAIYKSNPETVGSANSLFGLNYRDPITIFFE